jgi:hypothetical protein
MSVGLFNGGANAPSEERISVSVSKSSATIYARHQSEKIISRPLQTAVDGKTARFLINKVVAKNKFPPGRRSLANDDIQLIDSACLRDRLNGDPEFVLHRLPLPLQARHLFGIA